MFDTPRFIKFNLVSQSTKDSDTVIYIRADQITSVFQATAQDRKMRPEVNAIVTQADGRSIAVTQAASTVIQYITEPSAL